MLRPNYIKIIGEARIPRIDVADAEARFVYLLSQNSLQKHKHQEQECCDGERDSEQRHRSSL